MSRVVRRLAAAAGASFNGGDEPPTSDGPLAAVHDLIRLRIERALPMRQRYKYVQPRVVPEGRGWKVLSPNCSRNIDPEGGEIEIAWLLPVADHDGQGGWLLLARLHAEGCWDLRLRSARLTELLDRLCADPAREFWQ